MEPAPSSSPQPAMTPESLDQADGLHSALERRRATLKLDLTILPIMTLYCLFSFMDRSSIGILASTFWSFPRLTRPGNARIAGLQNDLGLTDHQYKICVAILSVAHMISALPSNLLLRKIGPHIMLPAFVTSWGVVVTAQGFVSSYAGLVIVRTLLGIFEGPMVSGVVLYLSGFYSRQELSLRISAFISAASLSGAFSGLLAAALVQLDGVGGRPGWAWIFIVEGMMTLAVGVIGFYIVPATPQDSRFLSEAHKKVIAKHLELSQPQSKYKDHFSFQQIYLSLTSPHVLLLTIGSFIVGFLVAGLVTFLPSIVNQLGFSSTTSQLLTVGPYAVAFIVTLISAYFSDRHKIRSIPVIMMCVIAVVGFAISLASHNRDLSYASLFFMVTGCLGLTPLLPSWLSNNSEPHYRRATATALTQMVGVFGGLLSIWQFPAREGSSYDNIIIADISLSSTLVLLSVVNVAYLAHKNKLKTQRKEELLAPFVSQTGECDDEKAWNELGDRHPDFVYIL
ncbi:hypothetical protein CVT24_000221 [Panaeolus cyanescens]|uniref:Major facilitator superfamily (MFS) profile domain-containing protein n=1 Tax=Panaeolus cyanescens TaxID=181874 RepID=A0A409VIN1_9AGAR|nr:hypothetical protein CVT24_000221 [Panaeolus cyanescens]